MHSATTGLWTPVALSADLPRQTVMPARLGTETIALWRSASGRATASGDRCPHRGMRLSHGFVRGEALSCIYHGWSYSQAGRCLKIPAHPGLVPPDTIRMQTFAVREQDAIIWVSAGAAENEPPRFENLSPLRSLTVLAGTDAIEAAAGAKANADGVLFSTDASGSAAEGLWLLLSDQGRDETLVHVLVPHDASPSERVAASRAADALRQRAEASMLAGAAS